MFGSPTFAMTDNRYKCLTNLANFSSLDDRTDNQRDLCFDLMAGRFETNDISEEQTDLIHQTRQRLSEWVDSYRASHAGADYGNTEEHFEPVAPFEEVIGSWPNHSGG